MVTVVGLYLTILLVIFACVLKRNNVHEDFLVILQFDWLSKTLLTLCIKWPVYHCPQYHGRFTDFIRGNCQKYFSINKKYTGGRV